MVHLQCLFSALVLVAHFASASIAGASSDFCGTMDPRFVDYANSTMTRIQMQLQTRHGQRAAFFPLVWWFGQEAWNCSSSTTSFGVSDVRLSSEIAPVDASTGCTWAQLTDTGVRQLRSLGATLGASLRLKRHSKSFIRSTEWQRTQASALAFASGMFPNRTAPVTIHVQGLSSDPLTPSAIWCPSMGPAISRVTQTTAYKAALAPIAAIARALNISSDMVQQIGVASISRICEGLPVPSKLSKESLLEIIATNSILEQMKLGDAEVLRLSQSPLMSLRLQWISAAASYPLVYWSAHDSSMASLMLALVGPLPDWPPFAAYAAIELWQHAGGQRYVSLQYNGRLQQMKAPCLAAFCKLEIFSALARSYMNK